MRKHDVISINLPIDNQWNNGIMEWWKNGILGIKSGWWLDFNFWSEYPLYKTQITFRQTRVFSIPWPRPIYLCLLLKTLLYGYYKLTDNVKQVVPGQADIPLFRYPMAFDWNESGEKWCHPTGSNALEEKSGRRQYISIKRIAAILRRSPTA